MRAGDASPVAEVVSGGGPGGERGGGVSDGGFEG